MTKHSGGKLFVKGQSGNPKGRPRTGYALAEAIRAAVDPAELAAHMLELVRSKRVPAAVRIQAASFLADRGWSRPAAALDITIASTPTLPADWSALPPDQRERWLDRIRINAALAIDVGDPDPDPDASVTREDDE